MIRSYKDPSIALSIDQFLETEAKKIRAHDLRDLRRFSARLVEKTLLPEARQHFDLHTGVQILIRILESPITETAADPLPQDLAELVVAGRYLLRGADFIPDWIPEIGLTDDARILARVFERHPSLADRTNT